MRRLLIIAFVAVTAALISCAGGGNAARPTDGDSLEFRYARNIAITRFPHYYKVELKDPWHRGRMLAVYYLSHSTDSLPKDGVPVRIPLRRSMISTTPHANLVVSLGKGNAIAGVADPKYMLIPSIQRRLSNGSLTDCGSSMAPDIEKLIAINCDAVLLSPYEGSGGFGKVGKLGVPIIQTADYMEPTALGRAEWMKLYGLLFGCEQRADSLFQAVEAHYNKLKSCAAKLRKTSVIAEKLTGSVWYLAGGRSSTGTMLADASADYAFAGDTHSGSLSLSLEQVLSRGADCDVWFFSYYSPDDMTLGQLRAENKAYSQFKAMANRRVFGVNTMRVPFFEQVSFRPDLLLQDYLLMLHPTEVRGKLNFYKQLQ